MQLLVLLFYFGQQAVRIIDQNGEPWWIAKDVCECLEIANHRDALSRLDEDDVGSTDVTDALGRPQETSIINEPGLYNLILGSRKPEAKAFKRWVTHEVLPSIRKQGSYTHDQQATQQAPNQRRRLRTDRTPHRRTHPRRSSPSAASRCSPVARQRRDAALHRRVGQTKPRSLRCA